MRKQSENGNALFLILIAVALFAALGFAFTQGSRSNLSWVEAEKNKANATQSQACSQAINSATKRLQLRGCTSISTSTDMASITNPSCAVFHVAGGGVQACGAGGGVEDESCMAGLEIGQTCASVIFIGEDSGTRWYTTLTDQGSFTWNNGGGSNTTNPTTLDDGKVNTDVLVAQSGAGSPYAAAVACRSLGAAWFLPSRQELQGLNEVKDEGAFASSLSDDGYWSSTERDLNRAEIVDVADGSQGAYPKNSTFAVRCMRREP